MPILHARFSDIQFNEDLGIIPEVTFAYTPEGVGAYSLRQGAMASHSRETLSTTDQGITMIRRLMAKQIRALALGADPIGVTRAGQDSLHVMRAGTWVDDAPWLQESGLLDPVRAFAGGRPWAWLDDGIDDLGDQLEEPDGVLVRLDPRRGIADVDPARLLESVTLNFHLW